MTKPESNKYFPSLRTIQFLRRNFEALEAKGQEIPACEWMYVELWEAVLMPEPLRFAEDFEKVKEMAF